MKKVIPFTALILLALLSMGATLAHGDASGSDVTAKQASALQSLRQAEITHSDIANLVADYNRALDILQQNGYPASFTSCSSSSSCAQMAQASQLLDNVIADSNTLHNNAIASSMLQAYVPLVLAPIIGVGISFLATLLYIRAKKRSEREFLGSSIRRGKN